ncbi:MAG: hypothetical protein AB1481_00505 [Candidatus Omnitrophota bacterium]
MPSIEERIKQFRADLTAKISDKEMVNKYISFGTPYIFQDDEIKYHQLKQIVATRYKTHNNDIIMIGSAKLGFSIAPRKLWRPFSDISDIDIVIISPELFDEFWKDLFNFNISLEVRTEEEEEKFLEFLGYFFRGWLRPDLFPFEFERKWRWFDFFRAVSQEYYEGKKITCAIFKDYFFFESYHITNIREIRQGG